MPYTLSISAEKIETLELPGLAVSWTDSSIANSVNRIGEFKVYTVTVDSDISIANTKIHIQPALFAPKTKPNLTSGIPPYYYFCQTPASITPGATIICSYNGGALPNALTGQIQYVWVKTVSSTQIQVIIAWYMGVDKEGYLDPTLYNNHDYFLKNRRLNPTELDTTGNSVYDSTSIDIRAYVYVENAAAPGLYGNLDINQQRGFKGGFYNKGTHGVAPYFTTPAWVTKINSIAGTSFSTALDTDIEFSCVCPSALNTTLVIHLIRTNSYDNTVHFQTNYGMDTKYIDSLEADSTKIIGAFTGPTLVSGSTYKWTFKIDKDNITIGEAYRMIAIVRYNNFPTNYEVTSFISDEYTVTADVPYNGGGLTFTGRIGDIKTQYSGNELTSTIEERMFAKLTIDYAADAWKNHLASRLGLTTTNDLRRYLIGVEFTIKNVFTIPTGYTDYFGEVYDVRVMSKTGPLTYATKTGIDIISASDTELVLRAEWRNRYEDYLANYASLINGIYYFPGSSNQDWGGLNLLAEWKLILFYDDYVTPFTDEIIFTQKFTVKDYVDPSSVMTISAQNSPFDTKEFWCPGEEMCLQGEVIDIATIPNADSYYLITNIEEEPGSITTIEESEQWTAALLGSLTTPKIYNQEDYFGETTVDKALFCVDEELLEIGKDYKISVIAKKP